MNILIAGVGGQGTLLASRIIGAVAAKKGYDVKVSEVHGMSQRGGSVETYVRYSSEGVSSPILDKGQADVILAFEELEAYRAVPYLKKGGKLIANIQRIAPMPVITGAAKYPEDIVAKIEGLNVDLVALDACEKAKGSGNEKAVNVVLIGVLASSAEFAKEDWIEALRETVPQKLLEVNLRAFESGYSYGGNPQ